MRFLAPYLLALALATPVQAADLAALAVGDMAGVTFPEAPVPAPEAAYRTWEGGEGRLSDYAGRVAVVNFWATWCAPCRAEMPSLQALDDLLGPEGLEVVTVAFGRHNPAAMERFWQETGVTTLPLHLDAEGALAQAFAVRALPHTLILDREGRVVAEKLGDADWASPEALALLRAVLAGGAAPGG
jgi:thiol-disulfide isomerase/thioredoxin